MRIHVRVPSGGPAAQGLTRHARSQAYFALGRFLAHVHSVSVTLTRSGSANFACSVSVQLHGGESVSVQQLDPDAFAGIERAAARSGRAVQRKLSLSVPD